MTTLPILTYQPRWTMARAVAALGVIREKASDLIIPRGAVVFGGGADARTRLVDMGAYEGDLAYLVARGLTANHLEHVVVRCEEGREINAAIGRFKYPDFDWNIVDYETCDLKALPGADVVICAGLLYHFSGASTGGILAAALRRTRRIVVIDSEAVDALDGGVYKQAPSNRHDHGLTGEREWIPSVGWVETSLRAALFTFTRLDTDDLSDGEAHQRYAWEAKNDGSYAQGQRRFWVAWR